MQIYAKYCTLIGMEKAETHPIITQAEAFIQNAESSFHSPGRAHMELKEVVEEIISFINEDPRYEYKIIVGADSQEHHVGVNFVSAIVVHRVGRGGRYFWKRISRPNIKNLRLRIYEEANLSRELAEELVELLAKGHGLPYHLEVHIDVGINGPTKTMINEVVGMIRGSGFEVKTKPEAYGASKVADRYT